MKYLQKKNATEDARATGPLAREIGEAAGTGVGIGTDTIDKHETRVETEGGANRPDQGPGAGTIGGESAVERLPATEAGSAAQADAGAIEEAAGGETGTETGGGIARAPGTIEERGATGRARGRHRRATATIQIAITVAAKVMIRKK